MLRADEPLRLGSRDGLGCVLLLRRQSNPKPIPPWRPRPSRRRIGVLIKLTVMSCMHDTAYHLFEQSDGAAGRAPVSESLTRGVTPEQRRLSSASQTSPRMSIRFIGEST